MTPTRIGSNRQAPCRIPVALLLVSAALVGCASPPSTGPLLEVVDEALAAEQQHLQTDRERAAEWFRSQRDGLKHGFEADLAARDEPGKDWMRDHVHVYVAAREALLREQLNHDQQVQQRITNLTHARRANQRAAELLRRQDELLAPLTGWQVWASQQLEDSP